MPSLRTYPFLREFRRSLAVGCERGEFRVVHYSVQRSHAHFVIEAAGKAALGRGMKSLSARFARAANRAFGRSGPVLFGRYGLTLLTSPRQVRAALAYALLNARKHWRERHGRPPAVRLDEASSGRWFEGWRRAPPRVRPLPGPREVAPPHTWLLRIGWLRHGRIDPAEVPGRRESQQLRLDPLHAGQ
jgi:hypothetical protein